VPAQSKSFFDRGGILVWGIVPTGYEVFAKESLLFLEMKLEGIWQHLGKKGVDIEQIIAQSMISPVAYAPGEIQNYLIFFHTIVA
jgi:hypothetical protein